MSYSSKGVIENGLKDFQLQPSNQGTTFHPTLGGAWGLRFRIFLAIFSTVIWISYCPLSSELVFQCHDLEEWKELLETSPTPTNQACPPPGLFCPLYHRIGTPWPPNLEECLWGILPGIGDPEKKSFKHKDRSEDYRALNTRTGQRTTGHTATFFSNEFLVFSCVSREGKLTAELSLINCN